jgi:hypothetical protein
VGYQKAGVGEEVSCRGGIQLDSSETDIYIYIFKNELLYKFHKIHSLVFDVLIKCKLKRIVLNFASFFFWHLILLVDTSLYPLRLVIFITEYHGAQRNL